MIMGVLALVAVAGPGMTSQAALYAEAVLGELTITGATVGDPVGPLVLASVDAPLASAGDTAPITGTWGSPVAFATPDRYLVYRKLTSDQYWGSTPIAQPKLPSFTDQTAENCARYDYRVFAGLKALRSGVALESSVVNDHSKPLIAGSHIEAAPAGLDRVSGFVKPGAQFYVYAHISDDCALADATLTADLRALGVAEIATLQTIPGDGRVERDGVNYNFRAGPFTAGASLADGPAPAWTIRADDGRGNVASAQGHAAVVDGTGPTSVVAPQAVPSPADTYVGASASIGAGGDFRVLARLADAGVGIAGSPVLDARSLDAAASAASLQAGTFAVGPETQWTHRSGILRAVSTVRGDVSFSISVVDRLGNTGTITGLAHIDATAPQLLNCAMTSGDNLWNAGDTTTLTFNEAMLASSAVAGWTGDAAVGISANLVHDGAGQGGDAFQYPNANLLASGAQHVLGSKDWVNGEPVAFGSSTLSRVSPTTWLITYAGASVGIPGTTPKENGGLEGSPPSGLTFTTSPLLRDLAGNAATSASVPCSISYVVPPPPKQQALAPASQQAAPSEAAPVDETSAAPVADTTTTDPSPVPPTS